jgi:cell division protein FtsQ
MRWLRSSERRAGAGKRRAKPGAKPGAKRGARRTRAQSRRTPLVTARRARLVAIPLLAVCMILGGAWLWRDGWFARQIAEAQLGLLNLSATAGFKVEDLQVSGRDSIPKDLIVTTLGIERDMPILSFDPDLARERLRALNWVKDATVLRRLPNVVAVKLIEHEPLALWQHAEEISLIDQDGEVIPGVEVERFAHLPLIVGDGAPAHAGALLDMLEDEPTLKSRVTAAIWVAERRWNLQIDGAIKVRLPEIGPAKAIAQLARIEREHGLLDKDVVTIDLRLPDRLVVRTAPGAVPVVPTADGENT